MDVRKTRFYLAPQQPSSSTTDSLHHALLSLRDSSSALCRVSMRHNTMNFTSTPRTSTPRTSTPYASTPRTSNPRGPAPRAPTPRAPKLRVSTTRGSMLPLMYVMIPAANVQIPWTQVCQSEKSQKSVIL